MGVHYVGVCSGGEKITSCNSTSYTLTTYVDDDCSGIASVEVANHLSCGTPSTSSSSSSSLSYAGYDEADGYLSQECRLLAGGTMPPTGEPSASPSASPSALPSGQPSGEPSSHPSLDLGGNLTSGFLVTVSYQGQGSVVNCSGDAGYLSGKPLGALYLMMCSCAVCVLLCALCLCCDGVGVFP